MIPCPRYQRRRLAVALAGLCFSLLLTEVAAIGIIVPRQPENTPPRLESVEISGKITNHIARTRITQVFRNPNSRPVEADFFFPVPQGADITDFVLYMDGKPVKGEVLDKDEAGKIYRDIVRTMKDPGLIDWHEKNLFRVRIFPVPDNGEQKLEIEISQPLTADQGYFRYSLPLQESSRKDAGSPVADIKVEVRADTPIRNLYSPTHQVDVDPEDSLVKKVSAKAPLAETNNFILYYETSVADITASLLAHRREGSDGYFTLRISPPWEDTATTIPSQPGDYVFVIDTSGSMTEGDKISQARRALRYCISQLRTEDRFSLIRFSSTTESFHEGLAAATDTRRKNAIDWIDALQARGGTNISEALKRALNLRKDDGESTQGASRIFTVVFVTDGLPTVGETSIEAILKNVKSESGDNIRVFTFGVGNDVNTRLLDSIAEETRAASEYVAPDADLEVPVSRFIDKINRPALVNVELEIPGAGASEIYPPTLPDLFFGTEVAVFGKYSTATSTSIVLRGTIAGEKKTYRFDKAFPEKEADNAFVEKLWATRKVAWLLDQVRKAGESTELRKEIEELAKRYEIVTPYTSYLAMEDGELLASRGRRVTDGRMAPERQSWSFGEAAAGSAVPAASRAGAPASADAMLRQETGSMAVNTARNLKIMKSAEQVQERAVSQATPQKGQTRTIEGKRFTLSDNGVWVDESITGKEAQALKVRYMSEGWFQILEWVPEFREIFSLGEQVSLKVNENLTVHVGPSGTDNIDVADKAQFFYEIPQRK